MLQVRVMLAIGFSRRWGEASGVNFDDKCPHAASMKQYAGSGLNLHGWIVKQWAKVCKRCCHAVTAAQLCSRVDACFWSRARWQGKRATRVLQVRQHADTQMCQISLTAATPRAFTSSKPKQTEGKKEYGNVVTKTPP